MAGLSGVTTTAGLLATVTGINAKTVAATTLYTVPTGKVLIVDNVVTRVTAFTSGGKTIDATAAYGSNDPDYNDFASSPISFVAVNTFETWDAAGEALLPIYVAGTVFKLNIPTGSNATTETWAVDLFGYLV